LNILHAGWPAGLVCGSLASFMMAGDDDKGVSPVHWTIQMSLFLIPVIIYGALVLGQKFPKSEAESAGVSLGTMVQTLIAPLMIFLLIIHAMVGYVELGTDSWISKISGSIMGNDAYGLALFAYTSMLMFLLRFVAGPIVHRISPLGLLCISGILGFLGLTLLGQSSTVWMCIIAATVYACGKTFLWPTMLAVVSEQFPKGGAVAIGMMGGVGMLSAGLLGGPAIGFQQDYYASKNLRETSSVAFERYRAEGEKEFFGVKAVGLDGAKVGVLSDKGKELNRVDKIVKKEGVPNAGHDRLMSWWESSKEYQEDDKKLVGEAGVYGGKMALTVTAYVPAMMTVCYLALILFFRSRGGYKAVHIDSPEALGSAES
jgi:hypothetical protein